MIASHYEITEALPIVTVLTAAATGSEADFGAVITNPDTNEKLGLNSFALFPKVSILDPEYTFTVPAKQTAAGSIDILSHLMEQYFVPASTYMSDLLVEAVMKTVVKYAPVAYKEPENYEARGQLMWASFNIGVSKPEEYGGLYGWGDATGTKTSTDNADYPSEDPPENISGTEYDIAHVKWGGTWRLPTKEEQDELVEKCDWKKGSCHGVKGYTVTGPNGNTIFLPGVGGRIEDKTYYQVDDADYWSGTLGSNKDTAYPVVCRGGKRSTKRSL